MGAIQDNLDKVRAREHYREQARLAAESPVETFCIDCGQPTTPGKGSARCKECWDARFGK